MTRTTQRIDLDKNLAYRADHRELVDWTAEHYGVNPVEAVVPGWIEVDYAAHQVRYLAYDRDDNGRLRIAGNDVLRKITTVQLDHEPDAWPFPATDAATRLTALANRLTHR